MITVEHMPDTNIAEIYVQGPIGAADYELVGAELERLTSEHDTLNFLATVESIESVSPAALWEGLKISPEYLGKFGKGKFERIALISDVEWSDRLAGVMNAAPSVTLEHFESGQRETALGWLTGN